MIKTDWRELLSTKANDPTDLLEYLDFYGKQTANQIEWQEDDYLGNKFITEAAVGATLFDFHYAQVKEFEPPEGFIENVNRILSGFYEENSVQFSNLITN